MLDEAHVVSALAARDILPDATQRDAIAALVTLLGENGSVARRAKSGPTPAHQGVYCHGLPGRGKSLVVDTVFELASCRKRRLHFHEFLREMNRRLVNEPRGDDRLGSVSRQWLDGVEPGFARLPFGPLVPFAPSNVTSAAMASRWVASGTMSRAARALTT